MTPENLAAILPSKDDAVEIMRTNDIPPLSVDGWAFLAREKPELAELLQGMTQLGKISIEHVTGTAFLLGLILQTKARD